MEMRIFWWSGLVSMWFTNAVARIRISSDFFYSLGQETMASTGSPLLQTLPIPNVRNAHPVPCKAHASIPFFSRRRCLILLTTPLTVRELPSRAEDIPLFGLRKKLQKAEEEAEEILKEGIETAERGIETAERGIETAEKEIETALSFGGLAQAGAVAGAEVVGVLVATSVVNAILGPEAQKS